MLRFILVLFLAFGAIAGDRPASSKQPARNAAGAGTSAQEDARLEQVIHERLAKSKIGADGFKVRVQGGVAYWEGTTNVLQHKGAATRMAKSAGAVKVVNNIQVSEAAKEKSAENLSKGRRRVQVKRSDRN